MTVIVLGAGATLAQAMTLRSAHTRQHPFLDTSFFQSALNLANDSEPVANQVTRLQTAIEACPQIQSPFAALSERMETFFCDVFYEASSSDSRDALVVFRELLVLYYRMVGHTTNWVAAHKRLACLDRLLRAELQQGHEIALVSFNQDLLAENAVNRLPRSEGTWCLRCLYDDPPLTPLQTRRMLFPWQDNCSHGARVHLYKLHGSMNWFVRTRDRDPKMSALFPKHKKGAFVLTEGQIRMQSLSMSQSGSGRTSWSLWPVVLPPVYDKQALTGSDIVNHQWTRARQALSTAARLVLWGYSIPEADVLSAQMLRRCFATNDRLMEIHCINPDPGIVLRVKQITGAKVIHQYDDIERYLTLGLSL